MPKLGAGMFVGRKAMGQSRKKKSGSEFWQRWQGAKDAGYSGRQAAAIAGKEASEQRNRQMVKALAVLRRQMYGGK